jgi:hypothetical protein
MIQNSDAKWTYHSLARSLPAYEKAALPRSSDIRLPRTTASSTNNTDYTCRKIRWEIDENRRRNPSYHRKSWSGMRNSQYGTAPISASDVDGELRAQRQRHPHPDSAGKIVGRYYESAGDRGKWRSYSGEHRTMRNGARYQADEGGRIPARGDDVSCELDQVQVLLCRDGPCERDRVQVLLCRDGPPHALAIWGDQNRSDGQESSARLDTGHPSTF